MTWNEKRRTEIVCPCGKGRVVTIHLMDHDYRIKKQFLLFCDFCEQIEQKEMEDYLIDSVNKAMEVRLLRDVILEIFDQRYLKLWQQHFALCPSKRAAWEILRNGGIVQLGLSSFYRELQHSPLPCFLKKYAVIPNLLLILSVLEIQDRELHQMIDRVFLFAGGDHMDLLQIREGEKDHENWIH